MAPLCKLTNPSTSQGREVRGTQYRVGQKAGDTAQVSVNHLVIWWQAYGMMRAEEGKVWGDAGFHTPKGSR